MSPRSFATPGSPAVAAAVRRMWVSVGLEVRDARRTRRWSVPQLAERAGASRSVVYDVEAGTPTSPEAVTRLATALGLRLEWLLVDPRRRPEQPLRAADPVHAAMGEFEAAHLRRLGYTVGIDEPYQHYQFAGRADLVAWDHAARALLHIENRTRFPDFQAMAGAYNAKRAYLATALAERLGIPGWQSETHVIAALWSAEVLHALRLRRESFRSLCPDPPIAFAGWWSGHPPPRGTTSALLLLDPLAGGRQRVYAGLDEALAPTTRPRQRGYAEFVAALSAASEGRAGEGRAGTGRQAYLSPPN